MYYAPMPFPVMALLIIAFICYMHKTRPKTKTKPKSNSNPYDDLMECDTRDLTPQERENISVMKKLVAQYEGYSAEVFDIWVDGRRKVETFRIFSPGRKVELKKSSNVIYRVLAFGKPVADIITPTSSNLPKLFDENIPFDAYLGGRDLDYIYNDEIDFASIIIFYKIAEVPPTKVILQ